MDLMVVLHKPVSVIIDKKDNIRPMLCNNIKNTIKDKGGTIVVKVRALLE